MHVAASGTHPFSKWSDQKITAGERYTKHEQNMADIARRMLVFGMHVHIGVDDPDLRIDVMNQARYFVPHFLALSTSSPFWHGRETGLKSYRTIIMNDLPRAGLPPHFVSYTAFERFVDTSATPEGHGFEQTQLLARSPGGIRAIGVAQRIGECRRR